MSPHCCRYLLAAPHSAAAVGIAAGTGGTADFGTVVLLDSVAAGFDTAPQLDSVAADFDTAVRLDSVAAHSGVHISPDFAAWLHFAIPRSAVVIHPAPDFETAVQLYPAYSAAVIHPAPAFADTVMLIPLAHSFADSAVSMHFALAHSFVDSVVSIHLAPALPDSAVLHFALAHSFADSAVLAAGQLHSARRIPPASVFPAVQFPVSDAVFAPHLVDSSHMQAALSMAFPAVLLCMQVVLPRPKMHSVAKAALPPCAALRLLLHSEHSCL